MIEVTVKCMGDVWGRHIFGDCSAYRRKCGGHVAFASYIIFKHFSAKGQRFAIHRSYRSDLLNTSDEQSQYYYACANSIHMRIL